MAPVTVRGGGQFVAQPSDGAADDAQIVALSLHGQIKVPDVAHVQALDIGPHECEVPCVQLAAGLRIDPGGSAHDADRPSMM